MSAAILHPPVWEAGLPAHLPFRLPLHAMLAWELYEVSGVRQRITDIHRRIVTARWEEADAQRMFQRLLRQFGEKSAAYVASIAKSAAERSQMAPDGPAELRDFIKDLAINDRIVCHAAMLQTYGWLLAAWGIAIGESPDPTHRRHRMAAMAQGRSLALYEQLLEIKQASLATAGIARSQHDDYIWQPFEIGGNLPGWSRLESAASR